MNNLLSLSPRELFERFIHSMDQDQFISRDELARGFDEILAELELIGLEIRAARSRGQSFVEIARDDARCPHAVRFQEQLDATLQMPLPPALEAWVRHFFDVDEPPELDSLRTALVTGARTARSATHGALLWFLLIQGVRLNLRIRAHHTATEETLGVRYLIAPEDIDRLAEETVDAEIETEAPTPEEQLPFHALVDTAIGRLDANASGLMSTLLQLSAEVNAEFAVRVKIETWLRQMHPVTALLLRNNLADELGAQRLSVERLRERYPHLLGALPRTAIDQRISRARKLLEKGGKDALRRAGPALVDFIDFTIERNRYPRSRP